MGPDEISPAFLKKFINGTSENIARLINMIISSGNYPKNLGLGRIKLIFKDKGLRLNVVNYKPIQVKNAIAKLEDEILFGNMLHASLERKLTPNIFEYRTSRGAEDAILRIRVGIIKESLKGKNMVVIAWDIKSAFEELPHEAVLKSISRSGASTSTMNVIKSYLQSQSSYVQVGKA